MQREHLLFEDGPSLHSNHALGQAQGRGMSLNPSPTDIFPYEAQEIFVDNAICRHRDPTDQPLAAGEEAKLASLASIFVCNVANSLSNSLRASISQTDSDAAVSLYAQSP